MNRKQARENVVVAVRLVLEGLEMIGIPPLKSRDPREPGRREKEDYEDKLRSVIVRHFGRQQRKLRERLASDYPDRKAMDLYGLDNDEDFIAELMTLLQKAAKSGVALFGKNSKVQIDWTLTNQKAMEQAKKYTYELVKGIDDATKTLLQDVISQFVETPGMTIRDVMDLLPFDEQRAQTIAVTEITRAYAQAAQVAGDDLKEAFPGVRVIKIWYTNNDEVVCKELCEPLNGKEVDIDDNFYEPEDSYQDGNPPRHVNCRCWTESTTALAELD